MVGDKMDGSSPSLFRMVAQQYVCAGNDHEGFGGVTEAAENSTQSSEQDRAPFGVLQKNPKPCEARDAV